MSDEAKNKWISKLTEIHQLCMDGKDEEASKIMEELSKDKDWDTVLSNNGMVGFLITHLHLGRILGDTKILLQNYVHASKIWTYD